MCRVSGYLPWCSAQQASSGLHLFVFEGRGKVVKLRGLHANRRAECNLSPPGNGLVDFAQYLQGLFTVQGEPRRPRHQHVYIGDRAVLFGEPGFGLALPVGKGVDVEGGSKAPVPVVNVQKAVVLQMVIHVGNQQVEENPAPQLPNVGGRVLCMGMQGIDQLGVTAVFLARSLQ